MKDTPSSFAFLAWLHKSLTLSVYFYQIHDLKFRFIIIIWNACTNEYSFYFFNNKPSIVPDIAIMLLIDSSGSMFGGRREGAIVSSVILHEVLKKTGIELMIVDHRAIYGEPVLQHNILVDLRYNQKNNKGMLVYFASYYVGKFYP